jgi:hypothetical protein
VDGWLCKARTQRQDPIAELNGQPEVRMLIMSLPGNGVEPLLLPWIGSFARCALPMIPYKESKFGYECALAHGT